MKITRTIVDEVPVGLWLVCFNPAWDDTGQYVEDVWSDEPVKVTKENYLSLPVKVCDEGISLNNDDTTGSDTMDFRSRLFRTRKECIVHQNEKIDELRHPCGYQPFFRFDR